MCVCVLVCVVRQQCVSRFHSWRRSHWHRSCFSIRKLKAVLNSGKAFPKRWHLCWIWMTGRNQPCTYQEKHVQELLLLVMANNRGFPGAPAATSPPANAENMRDAFTPRVRKLPWRRAWPPTAVFLPGESHRRRSLVGYSLWGCKRVRRYWAIWHTCTHN